MRPVSRIKEEEGAQNRGKKEESALKRVKAEEGALNRGKEEEGAQNRGKEEESAQNRGKAEQGAQKLTRERRRGGTGPSRGWPTLQRLYNRSPRNCMDSVRKSPPPLRCQVPVAEVDTFFKAKYQAPPELTAAGAPPFHLWDHPKGACRPLARPHHSTGVEGSSPKGRWKHSPRTRSHWLPHLEATGI